MLVVVVVDDCAVEAAFDAIARRRDVRVGTTDFFFLKKKTETKRERKKTNIVFKHEKNNLEKHMSKLNVLPKVVPVVVAAAAVIARDATRAANLFACNARL